MQGRIRDAAPREVISIDDRGSLPTPESEATVSQSHAADTVCRVSVAVHTFTRYVECLLPFTVAVHRFTHTVHNNKHPVLLSQVSESGVGSMPQPGKGNGGAAPPVKR